MCALRPWCKALIYRRQYPLCELFSTNGLTVLKTTGVAGYCQYVDEDNFSAEFVQLRLECSTLANRTCPAQYAACDLDRKQCIKPECPRLNITNGSLLGNMNSNGSRKQVTCNPNYIEVSGASITTCIDGNWTPEPQCIVKRPPWLLIKIQRARMRERESTMTTVRQYDGDNAFVRLRKRASTMTTMRQCDNTMAAVR
ncbi:hypothetical protein DPMN_147308 [Dreissena polymorpha]|uniref:Sushi domain-containing protein n=1 Tax=Dreissena polymorpha TaxID=45954 RepID=A0A9D4FDH3_DREPO|nr:hypothetical protein DPMN_147308 [Dreissena polymorpha]